MPNHVTNIVRLAGPEEVIKKFLEETIKTEVDESGDPMEIFDFNSIIPMPEDLDTGSEDCLVVDFLETGVLKSGLPDYDLRRIEFLKNAYIYAKNKKEYGHYTWYGWCRENWGTKWNAYEFSWLSDTEFSFLTAWGTPEKIWDAIAQKYPELSAKIVYADEDAGYNCGIILIDEGVVYRHEPEGGSDEAMKIFFEAFPGEEDYWRKGDDGTWEYGDEEEDEDDDEDGGLKY